MKKGLLVTLVIILAFTLTACGPSSSSFSVNEYETRLGDMYTKLNLKELAEISTQIIGASSKEFDNQNGWESRESSFDKEVLYLETMLGDRPVDVIMTFEESKVVMVHYRYTKKVVVMDFFRYIEFDTTFNEVMKVKVTDNNSNALGDVVDVDEALKRFNAAQENGKRYTAVFSWDYTSEDGTAARMSYHFSYTPSSSSFFLDASVIFQPR